ncbi:SCO family protein [Rhodohalobacter sp.]|uniref:SCO family protein n=1 Tax=Rhodohalobacter sp. TaxID=1974210 RepID=UPI002ACDD312|nr:SCO family protein [Rhodohalobacter sp.]MDZ7755009.1 SCO family protein [Rhodohalobacter sp.]
MIKVSCYTLIGITAMTLFLSSCSSPALDDYSDVRYELTDQNGETVIFPDDYQGSPLVIGFIYTNCPDICSFITANVGKVYEEMDNPGDTKFVLVTFDPERDTPEVLKSYAQAFDMDREPFQFLTGDPDTIDDFMKRVSVRSQESYSRELDNGDRMYFLNHTDKILLINENSELIFDYGGSMTPVNIIIEDLQKLL